MPDASSAGIARGAPGYGTTCRKDVLRGVDVPVMPGAATGASLGVIASAFIYETVLRHGPELAGYSQVEVNVKESSLLAWMRLFGPVLPGRLPPQQRLEAGQGLPQVGL